MAESDIWLRLRDRFKFKSVRWRLIDEIAAYKRRNYFEDAGMSAGKLVPKDARRLRKATDQQLHAMLASTAVSPEERLALDRERTRRDAKAGARGANRVAILALIVAIAAAAPSVVAWLKRDVANDRRCIAIQHDMLKARPSREDGPDLFQALGCRPQGEGSVYALPRASTSSTPR